jgi:hypothetical protein
MTENHFRRNIVRGLRDHGAEVFPIETGETMQGVPDLFAAFKEGAFWMELKEMDLPIRSNIIPIAFRPGQWRTLDSLREKGVTVILGVRVGDDSYFFDNDYIKKEYERDEFVNHARLHMTRFSIEFLVAWILGKGPYIASDVLRRRR